ncbi:MAG: ABC transporter permease [Ktedonobacteraceae bacterium]
MYGSGYTLRVVLACMKKDIKSALSERLFLMLGIIVPVNFLILMSLFVLAGNHAPTAVVMYDRGPLAQQLYSVMDHAQSFRLQQADAQSAQNMLNSGQIVAVVTIPADFDQRVQQKQPVQIQVDINNLNTDFTNDIRRAVPLSITSFYAQAYPNLVNIVANEHDQFPLDTDYIPYVMVSLLPLAFAIGGILQAGTSSAREWEKETIKELLLSPASREAMLLGKLLAALLLSLVSVAAIFLIIVFIVHVPPQSWPEAIGYTVFCLVLFLGAGLLLGTLLKQRLPVLILGIGITLPLFFVSGPFGPISFGTPAIQFLAKLCPLYYAIVLEQHAFHGFVLNTYGLGGNTLILGLYTLALFVLAVIAMRRSTVAH